MMNLTRCLVFLSLFMAVSPAFAGSSQGRLCQTVTYSGNEFVVCSVDLRRYRVQLFWKDRDGQAYGSFTRLLASDAGSGLVMAMNGGMYHSDLSPVGLYREEGQELKEASTTNGPGNFHLKPNGVFFVDGRQAGVTETSRYLKQKRSSQFAMQSGPMLVVDGQIHPKFSQKSASRKIRNGVGVQNQHVVLFAISNEPVTFHEFASLFRDQLRCANALFLDGSISSLYASELGRKDGLRPLGPIIGVSAR